MSHKDNGTFLTGGEECQRAAKILSGFMDDGNSLNSQEKIPQQILSLCYSIAIFEGKYGVSIARIQDGGWSAPCAIILSTNSSTPVNPDQISIILIMKENILLDLTLERKLDFGFKHSILGGPVTNKGQNFHKAINIESDLVAYVKVKNKMIDEKSVSELMFNWSVAEDDERQTRWHKKRATWIEVLTNEITVDRSSIGNALYVVINIASPKSLVQAKGIDVKNLKSSVAKVRRGAENIEPSTTFLKNGCNVSSDSRDDNRDNLFSENDKSNSTHHDSNISNRVNPNDTPIIEFMHSDDEKSTPFAPLSVPNSEFHSLSSNTQNTLRQQHNPSLQQHDPQFQQRKLSHHQHYPLQNPQNTFQPYQRPGQRPGQMLSFNTHFPNNDSSFQQPHMIATSRVQSQVFHSPQETPYYTQPVMAIHPYQQQQHFTSQNMSPPQQSHIPQGPPQFVSPQQQQPVQNHPNFPYPPPNSHIPPQNQYTTSVMFRQVSSSVADPNNGYVNVQNVSQTFYDQSRGVQQHRSESVYYYVNNSHPYR